MNILGVGAHFDDVELGCSGTLIKHINQGDKVFIMVICNSAYKNPDGDVVRDLDTAYMEGKKAAAILGAELICLNYDTFMIPFNEDLTGTINHYIEKLDINIIYSPWVHDLHRDHHYAAKNTLMAGRHVPRFLMYRSNYYDTEQIFRGNFYSDISDVIDKKIEIIKAHESELKRVRYRWLEFFKKQNENDGQKIGVQFAECFEVVRYLT
jgi:LmbE family N-acetylglucosaminyl deacetylase|tara:strand:+ start:633 stop:1259 length:627 start_codon:yes stop_codon:yes gene_type:complete